MTEALEFFVFFEAGIKSEIYAKFSQHFDGLFFAVAVHSLDSVPFCPPHLIDLMASQAH